MNYFIGIDIGTQGARVALLDDEGELIAQNGDEFLLTDHSRQEQSPLEWWSVCSRLLEQLIIEARGKIDVHLIKALTVTSTSGTIIPLDENNEPLHAALMYSDQRSAVVASVCKEAAAAYFGNRAAYTQFGSSSSLCKIVWFVKNFPEKIFSIRRWVHAADFITGKLCGIYDVTDETNALKTGYDIFSYTWPDYIYRKLPVKRDWLQGVLPSGSPVGVVTEDIKRKWGLTHDIKVTVGVTDGCASQIASGAIRPGDWNTTVGTTMVIKGVTVRPIMDPMGRLYNHRHPEKYFMPGGAGNTGADWVTMEFKNDLKNLMSDAEKIIPTGLISWPLKVSGERFPVIAPDARGFEPEGISRPERFAANMEGVAYIERMAYEMVENLSGEKIAKIFTAGGGSKSDVWLKIRSSVLNLPVIKMKYVSGAVGAAILAASQVHFKNLTEAVTSMTRVEKTVYPVPELSKKYDEYFKEFVYTLKQKGFIAEHL